MEPIIEFRVRNQSIGRVDSFRVVANSKNYLKAKFLLLTPEWVGIAKTAIFGGGTTTYEVLLGSDTQLGVYHYAMCEVPWEWLSTPGQRWVSLCGGDLITVNKAGVMIYESGYIPGVTPSPPTPDVYDQLLTALSGKADSITYSDSVLRLLSGERELARVAISGGTGSIAGEIEALASLSECGIITPVYQDGVFYTDDSGAIYVL